MSIEAVTLFFFIILFVVLIGAAAIHEEKNYGRTDRSDRRGEP